MKKMKLLVYDWGMEEAIRKKKWLEQLGKVLQIERFRYKFDDKKLLQDILICYYHYYEEWVSNSSKEVFDNFYESVYGHKLFNNNGICLSA